MRRLSVVLGLALAAAAAAKECPKGKFASGCGGSSECADCPVGRYAMGHPYHPTV